MLLKQIFWHEILDFGNRNKSMKSLVKSVKFKVKEDFLYFQPYAIYINELFRNIYFSWRKILE